MLEDSPHQRVFIASLEEFESNLIRVGYVTVGCGAVGLFGRFFCHSQASMNLTFLSIALGLNWCFGFVASFRTRKQLANVNFRNLNEDFNFDLLMTFTHLQTLMLVGTFIVAYQGLSSWSIELN